MSSKKAVELGCKVKDIVTGFEGIAVARAEYLHNQDSIGVRGLEPKDGKPQETIFMDLTYLEVTGKSKIEVPDFPIPNVDLGDIAEDTITGYKGTVMGRAYWISGCIRIGLQSSGLTKEGQAIEEHWCPISQVKVTKKVKKEKEEKKPGGPMKNPSYTKNPK